MLHPFASTESCSTTTGSWFHQNKTQLLDLRIAPALSQSPLVLFAPPMTCGIEFWRWKLRDGRKMSKLPVRKLPFWENIILILTLKAELTRFKLKTWGESSSIFSTPSGFRLWAGMFRGACTLSYAPSSYSWKIRRLVYSLLCFSKVTGFLPQPTSDTYVFADKFFAPFFRFWRKVQRRRESVGQVLKGNGYVGLSQ